MLEVFTVGGGEYLVNTFNAVAAWSGGGGYKSLIRVVMVMGRSGELPMRSSMRSNRRNVVFWVPWVSRWGKISRTTVCWCPVLGIRGVPLCPAALTAAFTPFYSVFCRYNRPDSRLQPSRVPARKRPPASFGPNCSNRCFYKVLQRV